MAAKQYLDLVNQVMVRVREPKVGSVNESTYSAMIGTFINDAKRTVEDAWNWQALRSICTFSLSPATYTYDLGSTALVGAGNEQNERSLLLYKKAYPAEPMAFDITASNPFQLQYVPINDMNALYDLTTVHSPQSNPMFFGLIRSSTTLTLNLWENPALARTWKLYFKRPQPDLANDTDTLIAPWLPIVLLATNYALNEKGEEVGTPGTIAEQRYMTALQDAIALDAVGDYNNLEFTVV